MLCQLLGKASNTSYVVVGIGDCAVIACDHISPKFRGLGEYGSFV